uniref:neural cell adhesion molecule 1-like isoform X2 n=1 Tax=Pristiophorus japonicus TaxID=55135 RepID=UPI00398ED067
MLLAICVLFLVTNTRAVKVRLSIAPPSGLIRLNQDKSFVCKVDKGEAESFHWFRPDGEEIEEDEDDRFFLKNSEYNSQLTILRAQTTDNGPYRCEAELDDDRPITSTITITVIQSPKVRIVDSDLEFNELSDAVLGCNVTGIPPPTVTWTRDGHVIPLSGDGRRSRLPNNSLQIRNILVSDAGTYTCHAKIIDRKEEDSASVNVIIKYAPKLVAPVTKPLSTWLGNPINISCPILSHPMANITWTRGGLDLRDIFSIFTVVATPELTSTLEVTVTSEADFATYSCAARNELGTVSGTISVQEAATPSPPQNLQAKPHSTTIQVSVGSPASDGGVPVLGYHLQWRQETASEWTTVIIESDTSKLTGLQPYTLYQLRAAAFNGKGLGNYSDPLSARTLSIRGEPDRPKVFAKNESQGNSFRIYFEDEDSGGSPITQYNIQYKEEQAKQWINDSVNGTNSYLLQDLKWVTTYHVQVKAKNQFNLSRTTFFNFSTPQEPPSSSSGP